MEHELTTFEKYHGKHYYMELDGSRKTLIRVFVWIGMEKELDNEEFFEEKNSNGNWAIYSEAKCGTFTGPQMVAWRRVKSKYYTFKRKNKI